MPVTRHQGGVNTSEIGTTTEELPFPDPTAFHVWFDDFDNWEADQWVVSGTAAGTGAIQNADGGVVRLTNAAADDNATFPQWSGDDAAGVVETWKFIAGKKLWFKARMKVSDATQSDFVMGLQITDTTPLAVTDGVYFRKDDGDANLDFVVIKDSTATTQTAASTVANDTWMTLGFYYDGVSTIFVFKDDQRIAKSAVTNLVDDEELTVSFGVQNGEAVAKTMDVDYIMVAKER